MGFFKFLAAVIGILAGGVAIYQFVTGYDSYGEIGHDAWKIVQVEPLQKSSPQQTIQRVKLERYEPFFREPLGEDGRQNIWAVEPGHRLPFTRPDTIVRLTCDTARECEGTRIMPVPKPMDHIDLMAHDKARREFVILDRFGKGAIFRFDDSTYIDFEFAVPCLPFPNFSGGTQKQGGKFTTHSPQFSDNTLTFGAHGANCGGSLRIGGSGIQVPPGSSSQPYDRFAYDMRVQIKFDAAGFLTGGGVSACRIDQYDGKLPAWFQIQSTVDPSHGSGCTSSEQVQRSILPAAVKRNTIAEALKDHSGGRLHIAPDIPAAFLNRAVSLTGRAPGDIIAILDDTQSRKADRALIFVAEGVYSRRPPLAAEFITYESLALGAAKKNGVYVIRYGTFEVSAAYNDKDYVKALIASAADAALSTDPSQYLTNNSPATP